MNYLIAAVMAIGAALMAYITLERTVANRIGLFAPVYREEAESSKAISKLQAGILSALLAVAVFFVTLRVLGYVSHWIGRTKMLVTLLLMTGAGCFDYREHRIPNVFPIAIAVGAVAIHATALLTKQAGAVEYLTSATITAAACALVLFLASALTKQGIGAGDIKLISAVALMAGVYVTIGTLFFGVVSCSIAAVLLLILKRKQKSGAVPFGPFLLFGYIVTLFITNY